MGASRIKIGGRAVVVVNSIPVDGMTNSRSL